jgi:hypothetical protein
LRNFAKEKRSDEEIADNEVNINELIGIDASTMPCEDLPDPFICCCFVGDTKIFVALFHGYTQTHYHFIWDLSTRTIIGDTLKDSGGGSLTDSAVSFKMKTSMKNFPQKAFYSEEKN